MKVIIFDASTLITLAMNGLLDELAKLKKMFDGKFIITKDVKREVIDKPVTIDRFKLEALKVQELLSKKIIEMPASLKVGEKEIFKKTEEVKKVANSTFSTSERDIHLIDSGEASCMALSKILDKKGIKNAVAVDERTARMIGEKPENLKRLFENKLHTSINVKKENYKYFEGFTFIRSAELVYVAYKKGLINIRKEKVLNAVLWALKFHGCSISYDEIKEIVGIK